MIEQIYDYELIDISFASSYDVMEDDGCRCVCENETVYSDSKSEPQNVEYDSDGIPMGRSKAEIKMREKAIKTFYTNWISENPEKRVWNRNLEGYILVKFISINETYEKAARAYESTKAVFILTEILENAELISELPSKPNNKNQKSFSKILIMNYNGIKLTVGYQTKTQENVQYCITVPQKEQSHPCGWLVKG